MWIDSDADIDERLKINEPILTRKFHKEKGLDVLWILGVSEPS
jgi:hypothetical protein